MGDTAETIRKVSRKLLYRINFNWTRLGATRLGEAGRG